MKRIFLALISIFLCVMPLYASQHDFDITKLDVNTGVDYRTQVNEALQALASHNSGLGDPAITYPYEFKIDESVTPHLINIRTGDNSAWVPFGFIDTTSGALQITNSIVDAKKYASVNAAVADIGTTVTTLQISNAQALTGNLVIPANISLSILNSGSLVAGGFTLTINGPFSAGLYQVFDGFGIGDVTFGNSSVERVLPQWWGAKGDGVTNDYEALQSALNCVAANPGATVFLPPSTYLIGNNSFVGKTALQLNGATNVTLEGYGATIDQGSTGPLLGIFNSTGVTVKGIKFIGYTGGTIDSTRQYDALITINDNSTNVTLEDNYFTNSLGNTIYVGGDLVVSGGGTGYQSSNITIRNNIIKERYGNGIRSPLGGTRTNTVIALIDVIGAQITGNTIYGYVDIEPNLNGQHEVNVVIKDNFFKDGPVTPQSVIGSNYNYDEPIVTSGGTIIPEQITLDGTPGSTIINGCAVEGNTFDQGTIKGAGAGYNFNEIADNIFQSGLIAIGQSAGGSVTNVGGNVDKSPLGLNADFIDFLGPVNYSTFVNNIAYIAGGYAISNSVGSDTGSNIFTNNKNLAGTAAGDLGFAPLPTDTYSDISHNPTVSVFLVNSAVPTADMYRGIITNGGASGALTLTLPACTTHVYTASVFVRTAQTITIAPSGTDVLNYGGSPCTAGHSITSPSTVGSFLNLSCAESGKWYQIGINGTWTCN